MGIRLWTKEKIIAELKRTRDNGPKWDQRIVEAAQRHFGRPTCSTGRSRSAVVQTIAPL
jgi:hypothetical protein